MFAPKKKEPREMISHGLMGHCFLGCICMTDMNKDVSTHHHLRDVSVDCACLRGSIHRRRCLRVSETCHVSLFRWTAFHAFFLFSECVYWEYQQGRRILGSVSFAIDRYTPPWYVLLLAVFTSASRLTDRPNVLDWS